MKNWQEELLNIADNAKSAEEVMTRVEEATRALGFEYCAYGLRIPLPLSNPKTMFLNNYPTAWQDRYATANYVEVDPTVAHGRRSHTPITWNALAEGASTPFWEDAASYGLCYGWAQSSINSVGLGGMLTLSRSREPITPEELEKLEFKMRWLATVSHQALARVFQKLSQDEAAPNLTAREIEVLRWTADGKTSWEISGILAVSENTVNFHIKNALVKLNSSNKTSAVVRAVILGLLN